MNVFTSVLAILLSFFFGQGMLAQSIPVHIPLSEVNSAFTLLNSPVNSLVAHPTLNVVAMAYRGKVFPDPNLYNRVFLNVNLNGGAPSSWQTNGTRMYMDTVSIGGETMVIGARHPQISIYNPPGNTNPANATVLGMANAVHISQSNWYGIAGFSKPLTGGNPVQELFSNENESFNYYTSFDFETTNDGKIFYVSPEKYYETTIHYTGKVRITRLTKSLVGSGFDTLHHEMDLPCSEYQGATVAFGPDGLHGVVVISGIPQTNSGLPAVAYPVFTTTNDGGNTWSAFSLIDFNDPSLPTGTEQSLRVNMVGDSVLAGGEMRKAIYALSHELDASVDQYNQIHLFGNLRVSRFEPDYSGYEADTAQFQTALVDFIIMPSGNIGATVIKKPQTYSGCYSLCYAGLATLVDQFSRPQISRSWTGDVLAFSWSETDSAVCEAVTGLVGVNMAPDLWSRTITATDGPLQWKREMKPRNKTNGEFGEPAGSPIDGLYYKFGKCASYLMPSGNQYLIPAVYLEGVSNTYICTDLFTSTLRYIHGIQARTDSLEPISFLYPVVNRPLSAQWQRTKQAVLLFPNPANHELFCFAEGFENAGFTISDAVGKRWMSGKWAQTIAIGHLPAGVYFYTLSGPSGSVVKKWIKE